MSLGEEMKVDEYKKIVIDYKESEKIRLENLALIGTSIVEKAIDEYIKREASRGITHVILDRWFTEHIHCKVFDEVAYKTSTEANESIRQIAINFAKKEGLEYRFDTMSISWE